jgi:hypothetical protein
MGADSAQSGGLLRLKAAARRQSKERAHPQRAECFLLDLPNRLLGKGATAIAMPHMNTGKNGHFSNFVVLGC